MTGQILTFTNLFPSAARPYHGCFVRDRMHRVAAQSGMSWQVVCPVPLVPRFLRRAGDRVLAAEPPREVVDGTTVYHVHYRHVPGLSARSQAKRIAAACLPTVRDLARGQATVLDAHYLYPDGVAAMSIARELDLPCVVTARGTDVNILASRPSIRSQMQKAFVHATALLAVSDDLRVRFDEIVGTGRVQEARNGVDLDVFQPGDKQAARRELGLPLHRPVVLGVGRLVEGKGYHDAAAALAAGRDGALRDALFVLVGEGPLREKIAHALPPERIRFLGGLSPASMPRVYQACDLLIHPSYREGWPNVVTEALACGRPVVATSVGGIPEILLDDGVGGLVLPGDVPGLQREIARFLDTTPNPVQARTLAARYSWGETIDMLSALFLNSTS